MGPKTEDRRSNNQSRGFKDNKQPYIVDFSAFFVTTSQFLMQTRQILILNHKIFFDRLTAIGALLQN